MSHNMKIITGLIVCGRILISVHLYNSPNHVSYFIPHIAFSTHFKMGHKTIFMYLNKSVILIWWKTLWNWCCYKVRTTLAHDCEWLKLWLICEALSVLIFLPSWLSLSNNNFPCWCQSLFAQALCTVNRNKHLLFGNKHIFEVFLKAGNQIWYFFFQKHTRII